MDAIVAHELLASIATERGWKLVVVGTGAGAIGEDSRAWHLRLVEPGDNDIDVSLLEDHFNFAGVQHLTLDEFAFSNRLTFNVSAIGRATITHVHDTVAQGQLAMRAGNGRVIQLQIALRAAAQAIHACFQLICADWQISAIYS